MAVPNGIVLERAFNDSSEDALSSTVDTQPKSDKGAPSEPYGMAVTNATIAALGIIADLLPQFGRNPTARDAQLRELMYAETVAASAIATVAARNGGFSWKLNGAPRVSKRFHEMIHAANFGRGWQHFINQLWTDVESQDKGGFVEIIREENNPDAPVIGIHSLDAAYCHLTDDPMVPVIWRDRVKDRFVPLRWYQVYHVLANPVHHPVHRNLQLSSMSRLLTYAKRWSNIERYMDEKTSGQFARAVHFVGGVQAQTMTDVMAQQLEAAQQMGLKRYRQPSVVTLLSTDAKASVATLELASLPEGWDEEAQFWEYITILALSLQTDVQELAPLRAGNLGSGMQSETLDNKSKRKGAATFRKIIGEMMNWAILPETVEWEWDDRDIDEEVADAESKQARAEARGKMLQNGEIDPAGARQMAFDAGDLSEELFALMNARDLTLGPVQGDRRTVEGDAAIVEGTAIPATPSTVQLAQPNNPFRPAAPPPPAPVVVRTKELDEEIRAEAETEAAEAIHAALRKSFRSLRERLVEPIEKEVPPLEVQKVITERDAEGRAMKMVTRERCGDELVRTIITRVLRDNQGRPIGTEEEIA